MTFDEIASKVQQQFGDAVVEVKNDKAQTWIRVQPARLVVVATWLRDADSIALDNLSCLTAADVPPERFEMTYHLYSYTHHHLLVLKTDIPHDNPAVDTVSAVWPAAEWHEREQYDLLGVVFNNHRELRRLMLPEDWPGHPLRKDWQEPAEYHGMKTTRTFSNTLFSERTELLKTQRPLRALLVFDDSGKGAREAGEILTHRLAVASIAVEVVAVSQAKPSQLEDYDLLIFGANAHGLLFASTSEAMGSFIDLLPDLEHKACALYVVYTSNPGAAIRDLDARVRRKHGRIIASGAVIRSRPRKDPDDLAAVIVEQIRSGALSAGEIIAETPAQATTTPAAEGTTSAS
ncbi:MAG: NADH-quinone oxidoreductase subunit C [Pseudomonadota bacterium]